jgi:threonine dehydrogenase-like Zn-dependent dehydrogenase
MPTTAPPAARPKPSACRWQERHPHRRTVRAYNEQLLPAVLDGTVNPGKVFDRTMSLEDTPQGYAAMDAREAPEVMLKP